MEILEALTCDEIKIVNEIMDLCKRRGIKSYIVGGAVRDAILGNKVKDIDICLEEDPKVILDELQKLKCCQYHSEFQTAFLVFENGVNIDLIRCRKEYYYIDGALPRISPSRIYEDLYRRDFTVNALAYDIEKKCIIDVCGGIQDLKNRVLRKIHPNSYNEDPTRIFRAIKYAVRYKFSLKDKDEIKKCVEKGVFSLISNDRIVKEIYLLCCEENWKENIYLCNDLKIFDVDERLLKIELEEENQDKRYSCTSRVDMRILKLFYSMRDRKYRSILAENSILNKELRSAIECSNEDSHEAADLIMGTMDNYRLYTILRKMNDYELVLLSWNSKLNYKIYNYIYNLRDYRPSLSGKYIASKGVKDGKSIGRILRSIMKIELNSGIDYGQKYLTENLGENM